MKSVVVLFSGGIDSSAVLVRALEEADTVHTLTVAYGQRNATELRRADLILDVLRRRPPSPPSSPPVGEKLRAHRCDIHASYLGASTLANTRDVVPAGVVGHHTRKMYVPARNATFLTLAAGLAEAVGADEIHVGFVASLGRDRVLSIAAGATPIFGFPDTSPRFLAAMEEALAWGTFRGVSERLRLVAPFREETKREAIQYLAKRDPEVLALTWSCYEGDGLRTRERVPCGVCTACVERADAFSAAGLEDAGV